MKELINRFTEAEKHFIDGMTNVFSGQFDSDVSNLSTHTLISIFDFCITRFTHVSGLQMEIDRRWEMVKLGEDSYDDLYDDLFNKHDYFFESLAESN